MEVLLCAAGTKERVYLNVCVAADVEVAAVVAVGADEVSQDKAEAGLAEDGRVAKLFAVHHSEEVLPHQRHLSHGRRRRRSSNSDFSAEESRLLGFQAKIRVKQKRDDTC
jgi:hypothetical protein